MYYVLYTHLYENLNLTESKPCLLQIDSLDVSHIIDNSIGIVTTKSDPEHAGKHGACKVTTEVRMCAGGWCVCMYVVEWVC